MGKRSKSAWGAAAIGRGQSLQVSRRIPWIPDIVSLSPQATQRLQAGEFSFKHGVPLACEAFQVSRARLYRWRKQFQPYRLEALEPRFRAPKRKRAVC